MSRTIQVTFDAHDPEALSRFWADAMGYVNPGPPGRELQPKQDPFDAWHDFLRELGVPESEWNSASAAQAPDGAGPRLFFQRVPEDKSAKNRVHLDLRAAPVSRVRSGWPPSRPSPSVSSPSARPGSSATSRPRP